MDVQKNLTKLLPMNLTSEDSWMIRQLSKLPATAIMPN
jgi:hypothetical protein